MTSLSRAAVGQAVSAVRQAAGLTLQELAKLTGIGISSLSRTEAGLRDASFAELVAIAGAVHLSVDTLQTLAQGIERQGASELARRRDQLEQDLLELQRAAVEAAVKARAKSLRKASRS